MIELLQITIAVLCGLFAFEALIECAEQKRIRKERLRVQAIVKRTYPRVY